MTDAPAGQPVAPRPTRIVLVVGTGTEVGKTWVSVGLLEHVRRAGRTVAARKPAQSFEPGDERAGITDAQLLGRASGEDPETVCLPCRWYPIPMAPPMAADVLGRPSFTIVDLVAEIRWPEGSVDLGLVETAGGVRSPLASPAPGPNGREPEGQDPNGADLADDAVALADQLDPDAVVLVADAGLGTINAVRLTVGALAARRSLLVVHLNRYDHEQDLHRRNRRWLEIVCGLPCVVSVDDLATRLVGPRSAGGAVPPGAPQQHG